MNVGEEEGGDEECLSKTCKNATQALTVMQTRRDPRGKRTRETQIVVQPERNVPGRKERKERKE